MHDFQGILSSYQHRYIELLRSYVERYRSFQKTLFTDVSFDFIFQQKWFFILFIKNLFSSQKCFGSKIWRFWMFPNVRCSREQRKTHDCDNWATIRPAGLSRVILVIILIEIRGNKFHFQVRFSWANQARLLRKNMSNLSNQPSFMSH